jgi:hypothetical protein
MACGHRGQGTTEDGKPVCAICVGTSQDANSRRAVDAPDLSERKAHCIYCNKEADSSLDLPFFELGGDNRTADPEVRARWAQAWQAVLAAGGRGKADALLVASMDDLHRQMRESCTGDLFYDGCRGWD